MLSPLCVPFSAQYTKLLSTINYGWDWKKGYAGEALQGVNSSPSVNADLAQVAVGRGNTAGLAPFPIQGSGPVSHLKTTTLAHMIILSTSLFQNHDLGT